MDTVLMWGESSRGKKIEGWILELVLQSGRGKFRLGRKKPSRKKTEDGTIHQGDYRTP